MPFASIRIENFALVRFDESLHASLQVRNEAVERRQKDFVVHDQLYPHDRVFGLCTRHQRRNLPHSAGDQQVHDQDGDQNAEEYVEQEDHLVVVSIVLALAAVDVLFVVELAGQHQCCANQGVEGVPVDILVLEQHVKRKTEAENEQSENGKETKEFENDHFEHHYVDA